LMENTFTKENPPFRQTYFILLTGNICTKENLLLAPIDFTLTVVRFQFVYL
jgi:hypothetical protein